MFTFNASAIAAAPSGPILLPVIFLSWIEMVVGCVCLCVISHCFFYITHDAEFSDCGVCFQ